MQRCLFGTDGVRGKAGVAPLDSQTIERLGAALVRVLRVTAPARVLVGRDTRESGAWIEAALARGVASQGGQLVSAGVIPTPAIAYLTRREGFDAGLVISASHNPFEDNGIKVFSNRGEKFDERLESEMEAIMADASWVVAGRDDVDVQEVDLVDHYLEHVCRALPSLAHLRGASIAIDCANGATTTVAPRVFRALGLDVSVLGGTPDGRNINLGCGSTHPEVLAAAVRAGGHRLGVAFDGDGDRAILVDAQGRIVDGDAILFICGKHMKSTGRLKGDALVATVMSNIGLELALRAQGIQMVRCPVGDKYVMEELIKRQLSLGGEQSGHVIFSEFLYTGDGLLTALSVLNVMAQTGRELGELASELKTFPQVLVNVRVATRRDLREVPAVSAVMDTIESRLGGQGRLLVRYSGTEPLLRIMIEGQSQSDILAWAHEIGDAAKSALS